MKVYPNPAQEKLTIELSDNNDRPDATVQIFDIIGRKMLTENIGSNNNVISVASLPAGSYFLVGLQNGIKIGTARFVKN